MDEPQPGAAERASTWWKSTWTLDGSTLIRLTVALAIVCLVGIAVGHLLTDALAPNSITDLDQEVAESLADSRTESRNELADWASRLSDTPVKVAVSALAALLALAVWRRWHEALLIAVTLIFEATAFILITLVVSRPRPETQLFESPVDSSFPSGHVAAATVYGTFAIIVFWHTGHLWVRALAVVVCVLVPVAVGWARAYQGMHYLSDVIAGVILGAVSIAICAWLLEAPPVDHDDREGDRHTETGDGDLPYADRRSGGTSEPSTA